MRIEQSAVQLESYGMTCRLNRVRRKSVLTITKRVPEGQDVIQTVSRETVEHLTAEPEVVAATAGSKSPPVLESPRVKPLIQAKSTQARTSKVSDDWKERLTETQKERRANFHSTVARINPAVKRAWEEPKVGLPKPVATRRVNPAIVSTKVVRK